MIKSFQFNWFYLLIAILFIAMLVISARYFKGSGSAAIGIAETKEYKINSEKSASVRALHVAPGRQVKEGDLLIELSSQQLDMDVAKLTNQLAVLTSELNERAKLASSEISYIKAQNSITLEELDAEILETMSEVKMNENLTKSYAIEGENQSSSNPLSIKINSLRMQREKHLQAMAIKIKDVEQESLTEQQLLKNQISLKESELNLLNEEKKKLNKYASANGVVKNVYVKVGEQVDAFTALLEINPLHPTTVVAYLNNKNNSIFSIGASVTVTSFGQLRNTIKGKVIGYGSVSELPEILQKSTAVKAFGQEVFIEISPDNFLANGEKVLIR